MATIKDIAQRVGVSTCTVSRYINGKIRVREETAARIDQAIKDLDYYKNYSAVSLKTNSSKIIALIIPSLKNLLFAEIAENVVRVLEKQGYTIVTFTTDNQFQKEKEAVRKLMELRVAGAIFITLPYGYTNGDHIRLLEKQGIQCLMINRFFEENEFTSVSTDFYQGARLAVAYLLGRGCRRLSLVSGAPGQPQSEAYVEGFREALTEKGLELESNLIKYCYYDEEKMQDVTRELIGEGADGLFCISDYMALAALEVTEHKPFRSGRVCLLSSGNTRFAELGNFSSLDHKARDLGRTGAEMLLEKIEGRPDVQFVLIQPEVVDRSAAI